MLSDFPIDEHIERHGQRLSQAHDGFDSENERKDAALESTHLPDGEVGAPLELVLGPGDSFPQQLHPSTDGAGQLPVTLPQLSVRPPRAIHALLRRHSDQTRHCKTTAQVEQVFSS